MAKTQGAVKKSRIYTKCSKCGDELPVFNHTGALEVKFSRSTFSHKGEITGKTSEYVGVDGICWKCLGKIRTQINSLFIEIKTIINDFKENQNEQE